MTLLPQRGLLRLKNCPLLEGMTRRIDFLVVPATDLGARCVKSPRYKVRSGPNPRKGTRTHTHTHTHTQTENSQPRPSELL